MEAPSASRAGNDAISRLSTFFTVRSACFIRDTLASLVLERPTWRCLLGFACRRWACRAPAPCAHPEGAAPLVEEGEFPPEGRPRCLTTFPTAEDYARSAS